jgi:orotidine-5'-phosphate decarboxylase
MAPLTLFERLDAVAVKRKSLVCVGLDPDLPRMPVPDVAAFNGAIVDSTADVCCAYKLQLAFYEALGIPGLQAMRRTVEHIRQRAPDAIIIGDCKRADIGPVAAQYARAMFEVWDFDAVTVVPYMGADSVEPWLQYADRGVYLVCRTSNPGAHELQSLRYTARDRTRRVFEWVADAAERWGRAGENVGIVAGATAPDDIVALRSEHPRLPFLVPGVGAQGADAGVAARASVNAEGRGFIINSSRAIIYASKDPARYHREAREACVKLRDEINAALAGATGQMKTFRPV